MAKELPYFKFEPSEWIAKDIQDCSLEAQGAFINICSYYWIRLGNLRYATALKRHCENKTNIMEELCEADAIKIVDDLIVISFLDVQLSEFDELSKTNSKNALKGWEKRRKNATALKSQSESDAIREDKRREDKRREEYNIPEFSEFLSHAKSKIENICEKSVKLKYDSWVENNWRDGNDKKIKNWKSKLTNTVSFLEKKKPKSSSTPFASPIL